MDRGQQPPPPQSQRPREPIRWPPAMDKQHGLQHGQRMDGPHGRQLDAHMGSQRQPHMERQPDARMMQSSAPALPFPPGMGDLMKQRLCMAPGAGEYSGSLMGSSGGLLKHLVDDFYLKGGDECSSIRGLPGADQ